MSALDDARAELEELAHTEVSAVVGERRYRRTLEALVAEIDALGISWGVRPSPEHWPERHAMDGPLMEPEGGEVRGYARGLGPQDEHPEDCL